MNPANRAIDTASEVATAAPAQRSCVRLRAARWGAGLIACAPTLATATARCRGPDGSPKDGSTVMPWVGLGVLVAFVAVGVWMLVAAVRASRGRPWRHRTLSILGTLGVVAAVWMLGLWIFAAYFLFAC